MARAIVIQLKDVSLESKSLPPGMIMILLFISLWLQTSFPPRAPASPHALRASCRALAMAVAAAATALMLDAVLLEMVVLFRM